MIKEYTQTWGVSGLEKKVSDLIIKEVMDYADEVTRDAMGNLIVLKRGNGSGKKRVMCAAHMDEIGLCDDGMRTTNEVKRYLRSGMGLCQGQTCQRLVQGIIASELKVRPSELGMIQGRAPVRPVEIRTFSKNVTDVKED